MQTTGYYRRRRGVYEHILDGRMSLLDNSFHDLLCQQADAGTGIVRTSAAQLHHELGISRKLAQKYLCRLERKGYIRRFRKARSRASQPTLIHLYECTALPHKGKFLDAWASSSWQECAYVSSIQSGIHGGIQSGIHRAAEPYRNLEIYKFRKTPAANPAAPSTPTDVRPSLSEGEQRRRIAKRDERHAREATAKTEASVGTGPEVAQRRFCSACGRTEAFHHRPIANIQRENPAWIPHEFRAEVATEVSTASDPAAQSIARARDIDGAQEVSRETGEALAAAAAAGAAAQVTPITHARETTSSEANSQPDGLQSGGREKPGPQPIETMTKAEIDAELRALKAKLAGVGNMR